MLCCLCNASWLSKLSCCPTSESMIAVEIGSMIAVQSMHALLPSWCQAGDKAAMIARIKDLRTNRIYFWRALEVASMI